MMELLTEFYYRNFAVLVMLAGMYLMTLSDVFLEKKMIYRLRGAMGMLLLLVVCDYLEEMLGMLDHFSRWRMLLSAICYSLRPLIVMVLLFLIHPRINPWVRLPAILNIILSFSVFFTDIVYSFTEDNHFQRGPLSYAVFFAVPIYVVMLFHISIRVISKRARHDSWFMTFLAVASLLALLCIWNGHDEICNLAYAAELLLFYLYFYSQYTKRDALTGLYNRHSFYNDLSKHKDRISGVISIDMNELKWMNDMLGHEAGDKALREISDIFMATATQRELVYRIGGDEFIMISFGRGEKELWQMIEDMRVTIEAAGCSCAFGLCCEGDADTMLKEADRRMYEDKARIKAEIAAKGGTLHNRT